MPYDVKFNKDLVQINKLIDANKILGTDEALEKFRIHLKEIINIGRFSIQDWNTNWRKSVYEFGTKFSQKNPIEFLNIITEEKVGITKDQQEVLDFYYSEIDANSLPNETCATRIEALVAKYPYNPEFRHTLGHFYKRKKEFEKATEQYNFALNKDKKNSSFISSLFDNYKDYLETFVDNSNYNKGLDLCSKLTSEKIFWDEPIYHNYLISLKERFKDYVLLNEKISEAEIEIKEIVASETQKGQFKIIEILGFITAIIAFIFSTVSIGKNFNFNEAIIFNISLGLTLIAFVLTINLFFSQKHIKILDFRVLLFIVIILSLLLIVSKFGITIWMN